MLNYKTKFQRLLFAAAAVLKAIFFFWGGGDPRKICNKIYVTN